MRGHSTFRAARGSRGVQDGRIVIHADVSHDGSKTCLYFCGPFVDIGAYFTLGAHAQHLDSVLTTCGVGSIDALLITDEHLGARVKQCEFHFVFGPPSIERHVDRANGDNGRKGHDPFGEVTHRHGHAVTFFDSVLMHQQVRETIYLVHHLSKRPTFAFVEKECCIAEVASILQHKSKVRRSVLEHFHLHSKNSVLHQFKRCSGSRIENCILCVSPRQCH
ncbi:unannotated protein [freshwater metagenome]|uniref:Unannotated protein n=1 Tax=freshwater metagenome TaxID=449393 RepID=A0A6J6DMS7_9ZZZZ